MATQHDYLRAFFFSVQTIATIGYGHTSPASLAANVVVTVEALVGLTGLALVTGLLFARFSRPTAAVLFSRNAVVAPYRDFTALQFRITNARTNQLIELEAKVLLTRLEPNGRGGHVRRFFSLELERGKVTFFPLSWTVVHPITESSPLRGTAAADLQGSDAEILVLLTGIDETFSQTVHARSSYKHDEIVWNARFADIFVHDDGRELAIDVRKLHDIEPA